MSKGTRTYHKVDVVENNSHFVEVVEGETGYYEYRIIIDGRIVDESYNEYSQSWIALKEGLNKYNDSWS